MEEGNVSILVQIRYLNFSTYNKMIFLDTSFAGILTRFSTKVFFHLKGSSPINIFYANNG